MYSSFVYIIYILIHVYTYTKNKLSSLFIGEKNLENVRVFDMLCLLFDVARRKDKGVQRIKERDVIRFP